MACACSKTSPSRHPPLTEPAIFPDWLIAIREPAGRGALPQVLITVATATGSPPSSQAEISVMTSRTSQSVVSSPQAVATTGVCRRTGRRLAVSQHPPRVAAIECLDRLTDASPARPVVDRGGHPIEGRVDVMRTEQARDASQAGGENEGLHPGTGVLEGVGEIQQQPCVPLHRTADVAEQHQWTRSNGRALPAEDQQLAAKSQATPQQPANVEPVSTAGPSPSG